jgi:eukaryotic-like serine/threonine-protein kinase
VARCFEATVAEDFVNGSLSQEAGAEVLSHAASCATCSALLQQIARTERELPIDGLDAVQERLTVWRAARRSPLLPETALRKGEAVDRYVIIRSVGATEDGVIYEAFDPDREQRVVVKQLDIRVEDTAAVTLMAVARRLCRFSHPNVLQMLAVGAHAGAVYLVYEFVKGSPLSQLGATDARATLGLFAQAGRGLAAVHDLGIAHGCFSAASCVVDREGRVKVLDFGLGEARIQRTAAVSARFDQEWPTVSTELSTEDSFVGFVPTRRAPTAPFESFILAAGPSSLGPRRYAAPELMHGAPPSPAADQYAFCASLYHYLYRRPAFGGESIALWLREVLRGRVAAPPQQPDVPKRVLEILQRGLRVDPAARFPRLSALLDRLPSNRPLAGRGGRIAVAAAVGASALVGVGVALSSNSAEDGPCDTSVARQWNSLAVRGQQVEGNATPGDTLRASLGTWMGSWKRATRDYCAAPSAELARAGGAAVGGLSVEMAGARPRPPVQLARACEAAARDALADLLQLLEGAKRDRLDRAAAAVEALPTAEQCAVVPQLATWPAVVARAEVRRRLGMLTEAAELLESAPEGETLPELQWVRGKILADRGDLLEARRSLESAAFAAQATGEASLSLSAATQRLALACSPAERALWLGYLDAQSVASPNAAPPRASVLAALANALSCEGDVVASARQREEVAGLLARDATPAAAAAALAVAQARLELGDSAGAEVAAQRAVQLHLASYGAHYPATQLAQLTLIESKLGDTSSLTAAEPLIDQIAADAGVRGEADAVRARAWMLRARIAARRGRTARALEGMRKAATEFEAALGGAHPLLAGAVLELGDGLLDAERRAEAEAAYRQVVGILESLGQAQSPQLAHARAGIQLARWGARPPSDAGETLRWGASPSGGDLDPQVDAWASRQLAGRFAARGELERAEALYRRALAAAEQCGVAHALSETTVELALFAVANELRDARELAERAVVLEEASGAPARPQLQVALAKALWREDRQRARKVADLAAAQLGERSSEIIELRQWIQRH